MNGNHKRILNAINVTLDVMRKNYNTDFFKGFTPSTKHYGLSIRVSFVEGVTPYHMQMFITTLQKCLPEYNVTAFETKVSAGVMVWTFKVIGDKI